MDTGLLILRLVVGGLFIGHGTQKLFGWFGGPGPRRFGSGLEKLGYRPGGPMAIVAGMAETTGGTLILLGLLTPLGAAAVIGMMLNATLAVHWRNGLWNSEGGFEFPLTLAAAVAALSFAGPGRYSVDRALGLDLSGSVYGLDALAFGVGVGLILYSWRTMQSRRSTEIPEAPRRAA
jgi:putative oxidoreductase